MTLSIIIVNFNVKPLLSRCLESIFQEAQGLSYEVIVVDNASDDSSVEYLKDLVSKRKELHPVKSSAFGRGAAEPLFNRVKVIFNDKNLGFAKANNQGFKIAQGEFILFLNPDTETKPGALEKMIEFMKKNPDCGIAGPTLLGVNGKIQDSVRSFPGLFSQILIFLKLHHLFPLLRVFKKYFLYSFDYQKEQEVDQVMGAFLLTRREVIEEVGAFDENFYIWFEEVDFCFRAKKASWKVIYTPGSQILHYGGKSFAQIASFKKQKIFNQSAIYYFKKHHPRYQSLILEILNPLSLFLALLADKIYGVFKR